MAKYYQALVEDHFVGRYLVTVQAESEREAGWVLDFYESEILDDKYRFGTGSYTEIDEITEITDLKDIDRESILDRTEYDQD